jgi:subtilisin family serine protease
MPDCLSNPASDYYYDFILRYLYGNTESIFETVHTRCVNFISQEYAIVYATAANIRDLNVADYSYAAIPKLYGLLDTTALEAGGILQGFDQPVLRATGRGVMIGFIDTGIDYTNPLFQNDDGTTRVLRIWDQAAGNDKEPYTMPAPIYGFQPFYGTVYYEDQINEALRSDAPYNLVPSRDEIGHGTFMTGAAAGKRLEQPTAFSGAAPEASIAVVKLKPAKQYLRDFFLIPDGVPAYQENDIMAGISFLLATASEYNMPLVVYLGVGTSQGSHDGTSPLGQQLQNLTGYPGIAVVTAAGNETGYQHHYYGSIPADQAYEDVEIRVGGETASASDQNRRSTAPTGDTSAPGFCLELWAREPDLFTIGLVSPSGEVIERIPQALGRNATIPFRLEATTVTLNYVNYEAGSGSQLIFLRFQNPSAGIWKIRVYPTIHATGQFHSWLPMQQFLPREIVFLKPDPDTTITDPGNAAMPTTIGAYDHISGGIYIHSSRGFTRSGRIKPEITAPGVSIQGPALPSPSTRTTGDIRFTRMTGTSASAAITAGAIADIFTWAIVDQNDLTLSGAAAQSMLIRGASRSSAYTYPSREWGFGTLNLYQAFLNGRE